MAFPSHTARMRWTTFLLVALAYVISYFHRVAPATIAGELQLAFHTSAAALGGLAASYFYLYMLMQIPAGILVDTLGPRRILTVGGVVAGVGAILFGYADTLTAAAVGRGLVGLGVSVTLVAMLKLNTVWFSERHFGTITGFVLFIGNLSAVLATVPLVEVLQYLSWRSVFVIVGFISLTIALLTWIFVRDHPSKLGISGLHTLEGEAGSWYQGLLKVLNNRANWPCFWVAFGFAGSFFAFAGLWAVPYLQNVQGMSRAMATQHTSLLLVGFALGALGIGALSDRMGRRRPVLIGSGLLYALCWLPLVGGLPLPGAASYILFLLMGLGAASASLSLACVKEVNPLARSGMAISVAGTGAFLGTGILQPLVGWALDRAQLMHAPDIYQTGMLIFFTCAVIGLLGSMRVRETHCHYTQTV